MKILKARNGQEFLVDDEDYDLLKDCRLTVSGGKPGKRYGSIRNKTGRESIYLHRLVVGCFDKGVCVDHINGDISDNRKENLRLTTKSTNGANMRKHSDANIPYKGIVKIKSNGKWWARICKDRKNYYLGCFSSPEDAAKAYNEKAKELFGEYAFLNAV